MKTEEMCPAECDCAACERPRSFATAVIAAITLVAWAWLFATTGHCADPFYARFSPRFALQGQVTVLTVAYTDPLDEEHYCLGYDVEWPTGAHSTRQPDCPPYADYVESTRVREACLAGVTVVPAGEVAEQGCPEVAVIETRWTWNIRAGTPGEVRVNVTFLLPGKKRVRRVAEFLIPGAEE